MLSVATAQASVLIVGGGIAGLLTALKLAEKEVSSLLVTKTFLTDTNSRYAQGGIAAVLPHNTEDSLELHVQDTLKAGAGLCDEAVVRSILSEGFEAIEDLLALGVGFDKSSDDKLALTKEAAHSVRRIVHAGGDATGRSVEATLIEKVKESPFITTLEQTHVYSLIQGPHGVVSGAWAVRYPSAEPCKPEGKPGIFQAEAADTNLCWTQLRASAVVLATGGLGALYSHTTNPPIATGDGLALATRLGLPLKDMEFIQFHPTAFFMDGRAHFLISEAFRGEGGRLVNEHGEFFAHAYHPDGELAPRDVVTRAIFAEMDRTGSDHVFLDMTHLPGDWLQERFPSLYAHLLKHGIDMRKEPIPVAPAAHYAMGGIAVDANGLSSMRGLYAVGEVACTSLHGANRLASNSLLECLVLARRVAARLCRKADALEGVSSSSDTHFLDWNWPEHPPVASSPSMMGAHREADKRAHCKERKRILQNLMWSHVGVIRQEDRLQEALATINLELKEANRQGLDSFIPEGLEYVNLLVVAQSVIEAALNRKNSVGAHYRGAIRDLQPSH